jgi:hypothetical protein
MATDPKSGHAALVEKVNYADTVPGPVATWTWTGSDWKLDPGHATPSPAPWSPTLASDGERLLYMDAAARLWSRQEDGWKPMGDAPAALRRGDDAIAIDGSGSLLLFGGVPASPPGGLYGDTWKWAAGTWTRVAGSSTPVAVSPATTSRPAHGLTAAQAIEKARAQRTGTPVRAVAGPMRSFWGPGEGGADGNRWVWAVLVTGSFGPASCGPAGSHTCPPPATTGVLFFDYVTGEWLSSQFPAPPQLLTG